MDEKKLIGYKVVRTSPLGQLVPFMWPSCPQDHVYIPYATTRRLPECGPMAVFTDLETALHFIALVNTDSELSIYECEYVVSDEQDALYFPCKTPPCQGIDFGRCEHHLFPPDTVLADEVKITERIK